MTNKDEKNKKWKEKLAQPCWFSWVLVSMTQILMSSSKFSTVTWLCLMMEILYGKPNFVEGESLFAILRF